MGWIGLGHVFGVKAARRTFRIVVNRILVSVRSPRSTGGEMMRPVDPVVVSSVVLHALKGRVGGDVERSGCGGEFDLMLSLTSWLWVRSAGRD